MQRGKIETTTLTASNPIFIQGKCHFNQASVPNTRPDSSALVAGDVWFDSTAFLMRVWNGTVWTVTIDIPVNTLPLNDLVKIPPLTILGNNDPNIVSPANDNVIALTGNEARSLIGAQASNARLTAISSASNPTANQFLQIQSNGTLTLADANVSGTSSITFKLNKNSVVAGEANLLKDSATGIQVRNAADNAYSTITVSQLNVDRTNLTALGTQINNVRGFNVQLFSPDDNASNNQFEFKAVGVVYMDWTAGLNVSTGAAPYADYGFRMILNSTNSILQMLSQNANLVVDNQLVNKFTKGVAVNNLFEFRQATAPTTRPDGTALLTGDRWYEPARMIDWTWDATNSRWLSQEYIVTGTQYLASQTTGTFFAAMPMPPITSTNAIALLDFSTTAIRTGAHSATDYYSVQLNRINNAVVSTATGTAQNFNTALAAATNDVVIQTSTINAIYTSVTTTSGASITMTKIGTVAVGQVTFNFALRYRIVRL